MPTGAFKLLTRRNSTSLLANLFRLVTLSLTSCEFRTHRRRDSTGQLSRVGSVYWALHLVYYFKMGILHKMGPMKVLYRLQYRPVRHYVTELHCKPIFCLVNLLIGHRQFVDWSVRRETKPIMYARMTQSVYVSRFVFGPNQRV